MEKVFLDAAEGYKLSLAVFPVAKPKAVLQMVHGMQEHKERYYPFIEYLNKNGYAVVISDMRGHGEDAPLLGHIADNKGEQILIEDQNKIYQYIKGRFKDVPVYLFGHSMGTIIVRVLMQDNGTKYSKVALSGYVNPNPVAGMGKFLTKCITVFKGPKGHSKMITNLAVGQFNKAIENPRTPLDWLSYNEKNVDKYIADPLCGVEFTVGSYCALFHLLNQMGKDKDYKEVNDNLPILLISGKDDPCTGSDKGREDSKEVLTKAGFKDISVITYENMRHEILNENEKEKVYEDILNFFEK